MEIGEIVSLSRVQTYVSGELSSMEIEFPV